MNVLRMFLFCIIFSNTGLSQDLFDKMYGDQSFLSLAIGSPIVDSDESIRILQYTLNYTSGITSFSVLKLDKFGDLQGCKKANNVNCHLIPRDWIKAYPGNILIVGQVRSKTTPVVDSLMLVSYFEQSDSLLLKKYKVADFNSLKINEIIQGDDNTFLIAGTGKRNVNSGTIGFFLVLDSSLNIVKINEYEASSSTNSLTISQIENEYLIGGNSGDGSLEPLLYRSSLSGEIRWVQSFPGMSTLSSILELGADTFLLGLTSPTVSKAIKIDKDLNVIWEVSVGGPSHSNGIHLVKTKTGFVFCGGNSNTLYGSQAGWIYKVSSDGKIEWSRIYDNNINRIDFFNNITIHQDYIIGAGQSVDSTNNQNSWVLKLDSTGCRLNDCGYVNSVHESFKKVSECETSYEYGFISSLKDNPSEFSLYDSFGNLIIQSCQINNSPISLNSINKSGMYFYRFIFSNTESCSGKIVIAK